MDQSERGERVRRRPRLGLELALIGVGLAVVVGAAFAGWAALERALYSPSAFVERYLGLLADGRAADALQIPGVSVDALELEAAGLPVTSDEALLRSAALASLTDISVVSEEQLDDGRLRVTAEYRAGAYPGSTTFDVEREGTIGLAPTWRFATSPLAVMELTVKGSMSFDVNGFRIDKRQVSPDGADADPLAPLPLLVFSPGVYSVSVDTAIAATPGIAVLSDIPFHEIPVELQATATDEFVAVVQERVDEFLTGCAGQQVLQPTGCPFGYVLQDRIVSLPTWEIIQQPEVRLQPDGAGWRIVPAEAAARLDVEVQSLFDGVISPLSEEVRFPVAGDITVLPDGTATIIVRAPD